MTPIGSFRISRYAQAFVDAVLAVGGEAVIARIANLRAFAEVWLESDELRKALNSPAVHASERRAVIAGLCQRMEICEQTRNLVFILSDRYLLSNYPAIVDAIEVLCEGRQGIERAHITSSRELEADERENLRVRIEARENSKIIMTYAVEPSMLGGLRVQIGSTVWDGTVKRRLDDLRKVLSEDDSSCPQQEEADSLAHWEDDGGASAKRALPKGFLSLSSIKAPRGSPFSTTRIGRHGIPSKGRQRSTENRYP
jgi:F-type H+-transporting ATPase subunit delta